MILLNYEELLNTADNAKINVSEYPLCASDGRIKGKHIVIRKTLDTNTEKSCVLAEELGHYYTTCGNILDQSVIANRKQEYRARLYGYNIKIGLMGIVKAYLSGCHDIYEMAEYLDVTEEYLQEAIRCYKSKYGLFASVDNFIIYFEPCLAVAQFTDNQK